MKVICDKHGDVSAVSLTFQPAVGHKHPEKFKGKAVCFYCLYELIDSDVKQTKGKKK